MACRPRSSPSWLSGFPTSPPRLRGRQAAPTCVLRRPEGGSEPRSPAPPPPSLGVCPSAPRSARPSDRLSSRSERSIGLSSNPVPARVRPARAPDTPHAHGSIPAARSRSALRGPNAPANPETPGSPARCASPWSAEAARRPSRDARGTAWRAPATPSRPKARPGSRSTLAAGSRSAQGSASPTEVGSLRQRTRQASLSVRLSPGERDRGPLGILRTPRLAG